MTKTTQQLLPLATYRTDDRQVAIDHMVKACSAVNSIINIVVNNGNIDSIEFDCEISPSYALRVIGTQVTLEIDSVYTDRTLTVLDLDSKPLSLILEEIILDDLVHEVKTYRLEREEYTYDQEIDQTNETNRPCNVSTSREQKIIKYANHISVETLDSSDIRIDDWTGDDGYAINVTVDTVFGCQERVLYFNLEGDYMDFDYVS